MSSHEKIPLELNLLLKQQNVNEIENRFEIKYESLSVETCENFHDTNPENFSGDKTNLALALTKWQMGETSSYINLKSMWEEYEELKGNLECIYHYFTCVKLSSKATKELSEMLINSGVQEGNIEAFEEIENDNLEQSALELIHDNEIRASWNELQARKRDSDIATKNFKILLEIIDFSWSELDMLKRQYDDVCLKYQHARYEVEKELPSLLAKMKEIFFYCLNLLKSNVNEFMESTNSLYNLIKKAQNLQNKIHDSI